MKMYCVYMSIALLGATFCMQYTRAYTCTFKNNTHADLVIKFYRDGGRSDDIVVGQMKTVTWKGGLAWSIKGMKILEMQYNNKEIAVAKNIQDYWSVSRPYNPTWELYEKFVVTAEQVADKVQFILKRNPGGPGGSTYPGGTIWTSPIMNIE